MKIKYLVKKINLNWLFLITTPIFVLSLLVFRSSSQILLQIMAFAAIVYLTIASLHHLKDKTLTLEIIIEYILIAALALIFLQGLLI